jgi:hypothetical protein
LAGEIVRVRLLPPELDRPTLRVGRIAAPLGHGARLVGERLRTSPHESWKRELDGPAVPAVGMVLVCWLLMSCQLSGAHLHVVRRDNPNGAWAKSRNDRAVPVGSWVLSYYERYLQERLLCPPADGCDLVFVNLFHAPLGAPMTASAVRQLFGTLGRRAGLARPVRPHMLRHAMGTELAEAGVSIDVVQQLLGHRSITSTQVYVHPSPLRLRDAVDRLEATAQRRVRPQRGGER